MYTVILLCQEASFWIPAVTEVFRGNILSCMVITWQSIRCSEIWIFTEKEIFDKNTTGTLILPDRSYKLEIFACMQVSASEDSIFATGKWQADTSGLVDFVRKTRNTPISRQWITLKVRRFFPDTGNVNLLFGIYRCKNSSSGGNETLFAGDVRRG